MTPADVEAMREHGFRDLEIAEAIHITALFATFNRVVSAFGLPSQQLLGPTGVTATQRGGAQPKEEESYARSE